MFNHFINNGQLLGTSESESIMLGDLDGDGDLDLVSANLDSQDVSILLNNGYGSFALWKHVPVGVGVYAVTAADIDNDGDTDIIVTNCNGPVRLMLNQAGQEFPLTMKRLGEDEEPAGPNRPQTPQPPLS